MSSSLAWPALPFSEWKDTHATLHLWTQIVGKIRLAHAPWVNHSWHVALYLTARGLTTSVIPYGARAFQIDFDFIDHALWIRTSDGPVRKLLLAPMPVAQFYADLLALLAELGLDVHIDPMPNEIAEAIPFDRDRVHASYDPDSATRFWRVLRGSVATGILACVAVMFVVRDAHLGTRFGWTSATPRLPNFNQWDDYSSVVKKLGNPTSDRWHRASA